MEARLNHATVQSGFVAFFIAGPGLIYYGVLYQRYTVR